MSRILAELLGVEEQLFAMELRQLEQAGGLPSHDVRLTAEIIGKVHIKARELGLDPQDTTGQELYASLNSLVQLHDSFMAKKLGAKDSEDIQDLLPRIRKAALKADMPKSAWVLKASIAKRLLKSYPPKKVMKYLGYKSLDSMLKREPVGELFAGIQLLETKDWQEHFVARYDGLMQKDFEVRPIDILLLDDKKWGRAAKAFVEKQRHIIAQVRELGVIIMLPAPFERRSGMTITVLLQLLHHMNEIRLYSSFYKLHQMSPDLGKLMAKSLLQDQGHHVVVGGQQLHWRVAQRHFGKANNHPEALDPHVQPDDLCWRKAEEVLYRMEPALHFWHDYDFIGAMRDGRPLSFNLLDAALNNVNRIPYEQRIYGHMQDSLWNELFIRYLGEPSLESEALRQLDNDSIDFIEEELLLSMEAGAF